MLLKRNRLVKKINIKGIKCMKHKFLKAAALTRTIDCFKKHLIWNGQKLHKHIPHIN